MIATKNLSVNCRKRIGDLLQGKRFLPGQIEELFHGILSDGDTTLSEEESALLSGLLVALSVKGINVQELVGAARAMRHSARRIQAYSQIYSQIYGQVIGSPVVDIVGTGGDSLDTFNISTTSSFVVAGAGLVVAKHGNRAASGRCGSADVLECCGVNLNLSPERIEESIAELGIGFLFAQNFHPAMRRVAPLRKQLGIRTIFNLLGPLTNPAGAGCVLLGVYAPQLTEMFAETLRELGCRRAMIVHGYDGMDELTVTTHSRVTELIDDRIRTRDLFPELYFGGELADPRELRGGDATQNADILRRILSGKIRGAKRNIVLLNSGAAIYCAGKSSSLEEGIRSATESIETGSALAKLNDLIEYSNR